VVFAGHREHQGLLAAQMKELRGLGISQLPVVPFPSSGSLSHIRKNICFEQRKGLITKKMVPHSIYFRICEA